MSHTRLDVAPPRETVAGELASFILPLACTEAPTQGGRVAKLTTKQTRPPCHVAFVALCSTFVQLAVNVLKSYPTHSVYLARTNHVSYNPRSMAAKPVFLVAPDSAHAPKARAVRTACMAYVARVARVARLVRGACLTK